MGQTNCRCEMPCWLHGPPITSRVLPLPISHMSFFGSRSTCTFSLGDHEQVNKYLVFLLLAHFHGSLTSFQNATQKIFFSTGMTFFTWLTYCSAGGNYNKGEKKERSLHSHVTENHELKQLIQWLILLQQKKSWILSKNTSYAPEHSTWDSVNSCSWFLPASH